MTDFIRCAAEFRNCVITFDGCKKLCGNGIDFFDWPGISNAITTWVFPIIGILLQGPFESNRTKSTLLALLRWVGSPISSLSYILWNIKVSGRAALMVDMATKYDDRPKKEPTFSGIRDSFYILSVMNQYTINPKMRKGSEAAEKLLRIALFDVNLRVDGEDIVKLRGEIADVLRQCRKRGVVSVFISMGWFLFSLGISIQAGICSGSSRLRHKPDGLGLGLMLGWIPVLILCSIVDRNPADSATVENRLNQLLYGVWESYLATSLRERTPNNQTSRSVSPHDTGETPSSSPSGRRHSIFGPRDVNSQVISSSSQERSQSLSEPAIPVSSRTVDCGDPRDQNSREDHPEPAQQDERRGASHSTAPEQRQNAEEWIAKLSGEACFGRKFFTGFGGQGRRRWHYGVAYTIVAGIEDEFVKAHGRDWLQVPNARQMLVKGPDESYGIFYFDARELWQIASSLTVVTGTIFGAFILNYFTPPVGLGCRSGGYLVFCVWATSIFITEITVWWWTSNFTNDEFAAQKTWERWFFIPAEILSVCWLLYIVIAQTFGLYQNCWCLTWGGWFEFETASFYDPPFAKGYWIGALCLSLVIMCLSFAFIIAEWCTQSHLATEDFENAMDGLQRTRAFKWATSRIRNAVDFVITKFKSITLGQERKSLVWRRGCTRREPVNTDNNV
ncbi:hypothetical protein GP486_002455 [Trichoglossum hirsutum]|uniref:Uncharacterized protein n=1 Tax=Trichoglossum hirsutum TaxID=265104 RepID=A0A9P8LES0_9PEZI|nr:hypothetical protein GP486_002455 [Trichoglossum hirsutum]